MAQVTLKGNPVQVNGQLPQAGSQAPAFSLVAGNLSDVTLASFAGKRKVLLVVIELPHAVHREANIGRTLINSH